MSKPNIQIDDVVREMTDDEYAALLATGWTLEGEPTPPPWGVVQTELGQE